MPSECVLADVRLRACQASQNLMNSVAIHVYAQVIFSSKGSPIVITNVNFGFIGMSRSQMTLIIYFRFKICGAYLANYHIQRFFAMSYFVAIELLLGREQFHFATFDTAKTLLLSLIRFVVEMIN